MYQYNNCLNNNTKELLNNSLDFYQGGMCTDEMKNNLLEFFLDSFSSDELIKFNWDDLACNGLQFISIKEYEEKKERFKDSNIDLINLYNSKFGSNSYADHVLIMNDYGLDMCDYRLKGVK